MKSLIPGICCLSLLASFPCTEALAFDPTTHALVTSEAIGFSSVGRYSPTPLLSTLDLVDYDGTIGEKYFDLSSLVITRNKMRIEGQVITLVQKANSGHFVVPGPLSITGWIMRGAIREDDNPSETSDTDEPGGPFFRVFNHFYDPANGKGLSRFGIPIGAPAPDWALVPGTTGPVFLVANKENHFTIANAREAMWRALTLKTSTGGDDIPPSDWTGTKEERRKAYWATVFRALGDVVHLVQDVAQPQHTRNDAHAG